MLPFIPDMSDRIDGEERMDDPAISEREFAEAADAIERLNHITRGFSPSTVGIDALLPDGFSQATVLDVGCGDGAVARHCLRWANSRDVELEVLGIDRLERAVALARRRSSDQPTLTFRTDDLFDLEGRNRFDIVHASLVLHHFDGDAATRALGRMRQLARIGVVVNDLHRHPVHWALSKCLVPMVSASPVPRHDGPLSIRRAFRRDDLVELGRRADFRQFDVRWVFPFRWLAVGRV